MGPNPYEAPRADVAIVGGALAGLISRAWVRAQTPRFIREVSAELGLPAGSFQPERYLL